MTNDYYTMTDNKSSKKIRIKRASSFLGRAQGVDKEVDNYLSTASLSIGSYWQSSQARRIGSGLNMAEEQILMPIVLSLPLGDREFWQKRDEFFASLEIKVPAKDGVELEVGLIDNSKSLSNDNLPLDLHAYVRYRFAKGHPWVAESQDEADGNQLKHFYIHDEVAATATAADITQTKDDAMAYYLQLKSKADKVNMMLTLLGTDYRDVVGQTDAQTNQLRVAKLREFVDTKAEEIVRLYEDKDFDTKYTIQMMTNTNVLRKVGSKYLITETSESLGTYDETVQYFKDEAENSDTIGVLKAKLQEAVKANRKTSRGRTK